VYDNGLVENLLLHLDEGVDFIRAAVAAKGIILVHCNAGMSRSASFVIAYLIRELGYSFEDALVFSRSKREKIFPNTGFQKQLR